jgi:YidC/Oxa1 family membrane protein insertase
MDDIKNLLLAVGLSMLVFYLYQTFYAAPLENEAAERDAATQELAAPASEPAAGDLAAPEAGIPAPAETNETAVEAPSVAIDSPRLKGEISLKGAKVDQIILKDYFDRIGEGAENIELLRPGNGEGAYTAEVGWVGPANGTLRLPDAETLWTPSGPALTAETPLELSWANGQGVTFRLLFSIDDNYMITVAQTVENASGAPVTVAPFGRIRRVGTPKTLGYFILHEGPLGVFDGKLEEVKYKNLVDEPQQEFTSTGGWLGFTDKYWLAALIPDQSASLRARFVHQLVNGVDSYQTNYVAAAAAVAPGAVSGFTTQLFAGAKEVQLLDAYERTDSIPLFDRAIDWGWFYFLTRPIFWLLDKFYGLVGNFGVAILLLTVLIKLLMFPLANKSYRAMSKMKKLQPKMKEIQDRHKDDKVKLQQEVMALYQREKANPAGGCLPTLVQIPVFFALYKVLFISIEMRQAPFFGWIHDLSAPDPLTLITGFGLIPWDVPSYLSWLQIGTWPILMGITMYLQQRLNPQSPDPIQAKVFMFMPIFFTFLLARFAVGLVIYWTWNNLLSILQQWVIMKREGVSLKG